MKNRVETLFSGYAITHASIENKRRLIFALKQENSERLEKEFGYILGDDELAAKVVLYNPKIWKEKDSLVAYKWKNGVRRAYAVISGENASGNCVVLGESGGGEAMEYSCPQDNKWYLEKPYWSPLGFDNHKAMLAARNIDGEVYFAGRFRKLFKRTGPNQWVDLTDTETHPNLVDDIAQARVRGIKPINMPMGYHAIDGFSGNDIYGGGHLGDLWHYNGSQWRRLDLPANFDILCICCAANGHIYVAGALGGIVKGRFDLATKDEQWKVIKSNAWGTDVRFNSSAWFQGRLYLATDWGLYYLDENDELQKYSFPGNGVQQYSFQHVTACDTALLSYGPYQALTYNGSKWEQIVGGIVVTE